MRHLTLAASVALLASTSVSALAGGDPDPLKAVWGGGKPEASAYSGIYVPQVIDVLESLRLAGYYWGGESQGTVMNAELVTDHPTNLAVGQLDILQNLQGQPIPGRDGQTYMFTLIKENMGPECLYLVTAEKNYETIGHVLANSWDLSVVTGGEKSGSYGTWQVLSSIYTDLADMQVVHAKDNAEIVKMVASTPGTFGFFVMRPDPANSVFEAIDDAELTLVPVVDFELEDRYEFKNLKVAYGGLIGNAKYVTTACTSVALISGDPANPVLTESRDQKRLTETLKRLGNVDAAQFIPDTSTWRDMWDGMRDAAKDEVTDLMNKSKDAINSVVDLKKGQAG